MTENPHARKIDHGADLIITNGKVWTVDAANPLAEAVAIFGDRILSVGSETSITAWKGSKTQVIDAGGNSVLPGFNDAHLHFILGGLQLDDLDLRAATSPEDFIKRIGERAAAVQEGEWILGGNWDEQAWPDPVFPARDWIDPLTYSKPVFLMRYDVHMAVANSRALELAGITAKTLDPPGGVIERDHNGNPTGILKDAAMNYIRRVIPPMTPDRRLRAATRAMELSASLGITSVQEMNPTYEDIALYAQLAESGELKARIYAVPMETDWQDQAKIGIRRAFGSSYLRIGAIKGFSDGSLGSLTAYFFDPYTDSPGICGHLSDEMQPIEEFRKRLTEADTAGLQLCIHAIGDRAVAIILDLYEEIIRTNGRRDRRLRVEHAQHLVPDDFARFSRLGVIASVQPYHAIDDGRWAERRVGKERLKTTFAFRTFIDHKVGLAIGTDWPVAPLNPMLTLHAAITRATIDGKNPAGWMPEQRISLQEAIAGMTLGAAYAEFQDMEKGSITPGKLADIAILNADLFAMDPQKIPDIGIAKTILGGNVIYTGA